MKTKVRESNIEMMRIILMIMIILHHIIAYNFGLYDNAFSFNKIVYSILFLIDTCCIMAVNCFFLVSGYYGIKLNEKNLPTDFRCIFLLYYDNANWNMHKQGKVK